jgi:hypothetical protein
MSKGDIIASILLSALIIGLVYVGVFIIYPMNVTYNQLQKECAFITHPELSIMNEQMYNHCLSYPETYGVEK